MKKFTQFFVFAFLCLCAKEAFSQVKIGDNPTNVNINSLLELESNSKGLLLPRLTDNQIKAMTSVPTGMLLFSTTDSALYLKQDTGWQVLVFPKSGSDTKWAANGNNIYSVNSGNVGIGTSSPTAKLDVTGNVKATYYEGDGSRLAGVATTDSLKNFVRLTGNQTIGGNKTFTGNSIFNGKVGLGTATPFSQLSNTSLNTIGSDQLGGNPGSFSWAAAQDGYAGQIFNGSGSSLASGLEVKVASNTGTAFDVSQGAQTTSGTSLFTVKGNGNISYSGTLNMGVQYVSSTFNIPALSVATNYIGCPTGTKLIGGGGGFKDGGADYDLTLRYSGPDPDGSNRWRIAASSSAFTTQTAYVYAICAKVQ